MKLYYSNGACSLAIRILINELNVSCDFEAVDLKNKQTETGQDFYKINPKGYVPFLVLENNKTLSENAVIHQYLAEKYQATSLLPLIGDFNRYHVLEWLTFITTELHKSFGPLFNQNVPEEIKNKIFIPNLKKKFSFVDQHLNQKDYLMGSNYTLPDGYLFVMLLWTKKMNIDLNEYPQLKRYFSTLNQRKSIQKSLQEEHLL